MSYLRNIWNFFASVKLTVTLVILICLDSAWGSILAMKYPGFYRALDQKILFPWLFSNGKDYLPFTVWIYALAYLVSLFTVNTAVCTADKVYSIIKTEKPWRSFFPHIVHIGFLVALIGHLAGSTWGFKSTGNIVFKGEDTPVPYQKGLFVRLEDVEAKASPSGELESLKTKVSLVKDKSTVLTDIIRINAPLIYDGIAFYHLDQGRMPTGLVLEIDGETVKVNLNGYFHAADGSTFTLGEIYPDFARDGDGRPFTRSNDFRNPYIEIISPGGDKAFLDISNPGTAAALAGKTFTFRDYAVTPYVILSINKDPGIWFIITGSSILVVGMVLLLFFRGERGELVRQKG